MEFKGNCCGRAQRTTDIKAESGHQRVALVRGGRSETGLCGQKRDTTNMVGLLGLSVRGRESMRGGE